ncbi:phosphatase PAP2 family protein [Streptomyces sp. 8N114]|uniref:phosphatase PAP2 family protein n=1 Tax=Streptomyces sp. 8N114 TaxID=3457419 RepID=UPI003FCF64D8
MSHTPRDPRKPGRRGRPGTVPPVPGRPATSTTGSVRVTTRSAPTLWACFLCGLVLALTIWQVLARGTLIGWDEDLGTDMRRAAPPRALAEALSDLGNMEVALPILAVAMALSLLRRRGRGWRPVLCYAVAMGLMAPLVTGLKAWTDRTGPLGGGGYFPSGHAATTAVALGGALLLLCDGLSRAARSSGWTLVAVLVAGNGLGLVWRGYHWPLDVVAGWCLGVLLLSAAPAAATALRTPDE